ncbi:beta-ureidopropionase isoform X2 [Bombyx mori]|uniref:beta-ureidopropionase isoform X2 n=1 Tax=Bombyx mori TaxID=7091 RepID=UPI000B3C93A9
MERHSELTFDNIIKNKLNPKVLKEFNKIYYGREDHCELKVKESSLKSSEENNFELAAYSFSAAQESRPPRLVKIGLIQHSVILPTCESIREQREAIFTKIEKIINTAASEGVQIICLEETWSMPFFLCTREKEKWAEFAESATKGPSVIFLKDLARKYGLVIVSPILEKDDVGTWWNTAVVIDEEGNVLGKHLKNHLPSVGSFSETPYYAPGNMGHPVFDTKYAKIAINICYGRHQALNWLMLGLNGAEIVFNPSATVAEFGESFWNIEARNAAIANGYFTCSINRVGTETFNSTSGGTIERTYYGSSYVTAPNGCRTPALSRLRDGLMIVEIDLNLNRQVRDQWGFNMTSRPLPMSSPRSPMVKWKVPV